MSLPLRFMVLATLIAIVVAIRLGQTSGASEGKDVADHVDSAVSLAVDFTAAPDLLAGQTWLTVSPGDDLQKAVENAPAGQAFRLTPGLYRLQQVKPKDGDI